MTICGFKRQGVGILLLVFLSHTNGQDWVSALKQRENTGTNGNGSPGNSDTDVIDPFNPDFGGDSGGAGGATNPRTKYILGGIFTPPAEVIVYIDGEEEFKFNYKTAALNPLWIKETAKFVAIKVKVNKHWLDRQKSLLCKDENYEQEGSGSGDAMNYVLDLTDGNDLKIQALMEKGRDQNNDPLGLNVQGKNNKWESQNNKTGKPLPLNSSNHTKDAKKIQEEEDRIARDFFAEPSEYGVEIDDSKLYAEDTCQPIGYNVFFENKKLWYSGGNWVCTNKWQSGGDWWRDEDFDATKWRQAWIVKPDWKRIFRTDANKAREGVFAKASTMWVFPHSMSTKTQFTPNLVRKQDVGQGLRNIMLPRTAYCRLRISGTINRSVGGRTVNTNPVTNNGNGGTQRTVQGGSNTRNVESSRAISGKK